jgi:hypothetical protein
MSVAFGLWKQQYCLEDRAMHLVRAMAGIKWGRDLEKE